MRKIVCTITAVEHKGRLRLVITSNSETGVPNPSLCPSVGNSTVALRCTGLAA